MSAFADIQSCLMQAWADHGLSYPTAYEGKDFTPPSDAPWCALFVMPASTSVAGLGQGAPLEHVGLLQVDISYPLNSGTAGLLGDAGTLADAFNPGTTFTYNGPRLMIERCERSSIRRDDAWLTVSITIRWRVHQHRA